jgi:hypothetical protein
MKFEKILNQSELKIIADSMLGRQDLIVENDQYYQNSFGFYNLPETMPFVARLERLVKKEYKCNLKFQNTYTRIYQNESFLGIHTDRPGLDFSISLCVKNNSIEWPLCISNKSWNGAWNPNVDTADWTSDFIKVDLQEGDAVICEGSKLPHWRNTLSCSSDEKLVYAFYHWSRA